MLRRADTMEPISHEQMMKERVERGAKRKAKRTKDLIREGNRKKKKLSKQSIKKNRK